MPQPKRLSSLSLFSGCGGLDLGLERAGFSPCFALDNDARAVSAFRANFPGVPTMCAPVRNLTKDQLFAITGLKPGELDLLAGGPPCPPFSKSRFYRKEKPRALDDPNGWETVNGFLNVLEWTRPRAFLMENVKGLAYKVHRDALDSIVQRARDSGYKVSWKVFNAADFGVPQIRERCFVIGLRSGQFEFPRPTHNREGEGSLIPWVSAGSALDDLDTDDLACDIGHFAGGKHHDLLKMVPPGDNYLYFTEKRGHPNPQFKWRGRYWSFLLKLNRDLPAWTIQARRSNNMGPFHWRSRILRIEEIKRLQTFPDDFRLSGTIEQQWRQVGNAVPPLLAEAMGRALATQLTEEVRRAA